MASSSSSASSQPHIHPSPATGAEPLGCDPQEHHLPIEIVTEASQLPIEFLNPSPDHELVIGFDCEGIDLCRYGRLCVIQLAFPDVIYIVDAINGEKGLVSACKPGLQSSHIKKVVHDCKRDSEALNFQFGIKLHNVFDTQLAYSLIEEQEGRHRPHDAYISFVNLLADPRYCGVSYLEKEKVRTLFREDLEFWAHRPLTELMKRAASDDVRFLLQIYRKMMEKLSERSLWHLSLRGELYCRCFCINNNNYADWPPLPSVADCPAGEDGIDPPQEEILSVLEVPYPKMGLIIGKKGAVILAIKQAVKAEIFMGGSKGPPDKVFVIGPVREVRKAEALMRGRITEF
ncbi:piRNA biogenesis protein EXD1 [Linum perenne]